MGGPSAEREVSLRSGAAVAAALREAGYARVDEVDATEAALPALDGAEAVFIALHGAYGEDGGAQADLEALGIPYTGTRAAAMPVSFDKVRTKKRLRAAGLPVAEDEVLPAGCDRTSLPPPFVVKPPSQGSSVGVTVVTALQQWEEALAASRAYEPDVLVERYIPGRELTVGVLHGEALPVVEIVPAAGHYDYDAKYAHENGPTEYRVPAPIEPATAAEAQRLAVETFRALEAEHLARVDFRLDPEGALHILELNTIPGFTATSLLPKAAVSAGVAFPDLCRSIMEAAR